MGKRLLIAVAICSFTLSAPVLAQPDLSDELAALRAEIARLNDRLERLEQSNAAVPAETVVVDARPQAGPRVEVSGDLRYRHETINDDAFAVRHRQRIRARIGIDAEISDDISVGMVLATGGDNPVSANQSLDGGFTRKDIGVDRAFFDWEIGNGLSLVGGKMRNPFFRPGGNPLIYDGDLNPEGLALKYENERWFFNTAGLWVEERAGTSDSSMLGAQAGFRTDSLGGNRLTAGLSYYNYNNLQGQTPIYTGVGNGQGNFLDVNGNYLNKFENVELFAELELSVADRPLTLFADYVVNNEADAADTGYAVGMVYGDVTGARTWEVGYAYQRLEADAVVAAFTDSDWSGGGTDGKGHVLTFDYGLGRQWGLAFTYFLNERGMDAGNPRDYNRLQADINFRY